MGAVKELQDNAFSNIRLNNTFISFFPKKEGNKSIGDFRPISLLSRSYKISAGALVN